MPFHKRLVGSPGGLGLARGPAGTLQDLSAHSLVLVLRQLADLSRQAGGIFSELQAETGELCLRGARLERRLGALQSSARRLDHRKVPVPVSNLDEENKWTVHYTAPWHHQENVFLPSSRPPCVEDLHQQAKVNLKSVLRECDKLRRDGYRSSQYYSQGPTFSASTSALCSGRSEDEDEQDRKSSVSSTEEEHLLGIMRPKTPVPDDFTDIHTQTNWTKSLPLPTPEEKMRQQAQAIPTDVVPINVTGENFDRQASIRRSLVYTDTVVRRPKKVKRRKTITGVPDNIQKELAGIGHSDFRGHSLYIPEHYATLGKLETCHTSPQRFGTRDTSCQTDDIKVVPPSVRRIRAQKGHGIAAQMSHMSSSSCNMSTVSDSAGVLVAPRLNGDLNFHSLPRPGARVSLHSLDQKPSLAYHMGNSAPTSCGQISKLQVDDSVVHMRNIPRNGTLPRPKSQEVRSRENELCNPARVVSPHAAYSMSVIPNATLSSTSEMIVLHTSQSMVQLDNRVTSSSSYRRVAAGKHPGAGNAIGAKVDQHSSNGNWSDGSPLHHSQTSDAVPTNALLRPSVSNCAVSLSAVGGSINRSQSMTYGSRNTPNFPTNSLDSDEHSESNYSENRELKTSVSSTENWVFEREGNGDTPSRKTSTGTPGYSTPASNMSTSSYDGTSVRADSTSLCSLDHDGYYTTMHVDSGLRSARINGFETSKQSPVKVSGERDNLSNDKSSYSDKSLTRSISLKKPKKPPPPPSRTDSLRRPPKKKVQSNGQVLNETLIATLQQSLQLNLKYKNSSSPSQSPCSDYEDPWVVRSRSQSTVSASSSGLSATTPNMYSICPVTPSQSDASSVKSEYADPWAYYMDYTGNRDEQTKAPVSQSLNTTVVQNNCNNSHYNYGSRTSAPQVPDIPTKPKNASPEKPHRVTSPSSGYSSQSNTPTALTPVPAFLKTMSPGNGKVKLKPKVPERKSSLVSSVSISSSSTSLSSNTSDTLQNSGMNSACVVHLASPPTPPYTPELPPPPSPQVNLSHPASPSFPPPPPEAMNHSMPFGAAAFLYPPATVFNNLTVANMALPLQPPAPFFPPSAPPLDPNFMKGAGRQKPHLLKNCLHELSPKTASKPQESFQPTVPLVTTHDLQMVQLRTTKNAPRLELYHSDGLASQPGGQEKPTAVTLKDSRQPSASQEHRMTIEQDEPMTVNPTTVTHQHMQVQSTQPCPQTETVSHDSLSKAIFQEKPLEAAFLQLHVSDSQTALTQQEKPPADPGIVSPMERLESPKKILSPYPSPSKKPPPISKKPKLFLIVPPPQQDLAAGKVAEVHENVRSMPSVDQPDSAITHWEEAEHGLMAERSTEETDSGIDVPIARNAGPDSWEMEEAMGAVFSPAAQPQPAPLRTASVEEQTSWDDGSSSDSNADLYSSADAKPPQEEEQDVFDSDESVFSPSYSSFKEGSSFREGGEEAGTPNRLRTTEDLFAAIHRSKRKVLGRKDSDDDRSRNHSPSPPVTPTGVGPNLTFKQMGSIQRNLRKTTTSSDNFKALLLKKGSRSEYSSRMSAAEMLKNSDPRFQRSRSESSPELPDSPLFGSPGKNRRAQEEWAKSEGLMPRSMSLSSTRYSRSRTPPSAASSKYNVRNRIQSSPMTVICEGEGEATDTVDNGGFQTLQNRKEDFGGWHHNDTDSNESLDNDEPKTPVSRDLMAVMMKEDVAEMCFSPSAEES